METKNNQSAPLAAAMETAPATSKPPVVVEKMSRGFKGHENKRSGLLNRKGSDTMTIFAKTPSLNEGEILYYNPQINYKRKEQYIDTR